MPYQTQAAALAIREALDLGAAVDKSCSKGPFRGRPASIMLLPLATALLNVQDLKSDLCWNSADQ